MGCTSFLHILFKRLQFIFSYLNTLITLHINQFCTNKYLPNLKLDYEIKAGHTNKSHYFLLCHYSLLDPKAKQTEEWTDGRRTNRRTGACSGL